MRLLRTLLASLAILAAGLATLSAATDGFRAYTTETARRIDVHEHPRAVPDALLQTADGHIVELASLRGRWLLVDFIYTRCETYCSVQGSSSRSCNSGWPSRSPKAGWRCSASASIRHTTARHDWPPTSSVRAIAAPDGSRHARQTRLTSVR